MKLRTRIFSLLVSVSLLAGAVPAAAAAGSQTKEQTCASTPFTDVKPGVWYDNAVDYVYNHGMMSGVTSTTFKPNGTVSRAMVAQILYNQAGKPAVSFTTSSFTDVSAEKWYFTAIEWAYQNGYASGTGNNRFAPDASVTRAQLAQFLYNYAGRPSVSVSVLSSFADAASVQSWAKSALAWSVKNRLISGISSGGKTYLKPQDTATRAQAAIILRAYDMRDQTAAARSLYYNYLMQNAKPALNNIPQAAACVDIDNDGIPELILHDTQQYFCNMVYTYNPSTGKMLLLGEQVSYGKGYGMTIYYNTSTHQVCLPSADTGGASYYVYTINGIKTPAVSYFRMNNGKFEQGCTIDGKQVSESVFNAKLKAIQVTAVSASYTTVAQQIS
ncbi:S-layer homology domain-containing protein [Butyricicoccus sp.]|uniref:S-layer homology domain-containing protein n=1 Tax=Butyricicoccus sp. TaxID=2049021 RepID=UPI003F17E4F5